ncbi:MAG: hypothetical protein WC328_04620 [Kiritimatiellia bacterium]|jgi:hypothetical protein|nr:hypothetical protein [Kiritimatiellia bacterium]MDD4173247.1 hypothetical protein [Kiritimatiellia bacterium]MDD4441643.1 hypothetical protein [Kiritimatiellia bacterium]
MKRYRGFTVCLAAAVFGAVTLASQTLLLRRFLWRFESAELGVALFLSSWLFGAGLGAAAAATPPGRRLIRHLAGHVWLPPLLCALLYLGHYAAIGNLRAWLGLPAYHAFPLMHLALGCLLVNLPFCFAIGWGVPAFCLALERMGLPVGRAFAAEALGSALCGAILTALLTAGVAPDPRDAAEWGRFFPQADTTPGRFETGGGTTLFGIHGGSFYALTSGGVSELLPEGDRAVEQAVLALSQRPYAASALLLGQVPLATALALESLRPDLAITWCPPDARYGTLLLRAVTAAGIRTSVRAAGTPPRRFLDEQPEGNYDLVMVQPPPTTSLGGAAWHDPAFIRAVRRVTRRTGTALFALPCDATHLTSERAALLDASARPVRLIWPESGVLAAGAGGWWIAAQVPGLAYGAEAAPSRFARLKKAARFPTEAVSLLYDAPRASRLAETCPALDPTHDVLLPEAFRAERMLALGLADAVRSEYPTSAPGAALAWLTDPQKNRGSRLLGLLLVMLWAAPVALGGARHAPRRLWAAWLAGCGALGLVVSLAVLYQLHARFGALYVLAGAGGALYLGGLFCGNRLGERLTARWPADSVAWRAAALLLPLAQATVAWAALSGSASLDAAWSVVALCLPAGAAAGSAVPVALGARLDRQAEDVAVFVLADATGAALAGLAFTLLVPLAGLDGAVLCFAALAAGLGLCAAACGGTPRLATGLALTAAGVMLIGGVFAPTPNRLVIRRADGDMPAAHGAGMNEDTIRPRSAQRPTLNVQTGVKPQKLDERKERSTATRMNDTPGPRGIPRKLDERRIRAQLRDGTLSTNEAAFWQ